MPLGFTSVVGARSAYIGFGVLLALMVAIFVFTNQQSQLFDDLQRSIQQRRTLVKISADLLDAETGQRGYLLTSNGLYLDPYRSAVTHIGMDLAALEDLSDGIDPDALKDLEKLVDQKLAELRATIEMHDANRAGEALALVNTGAGMAIMDQIRSHVETLSVALRQKIDARVDAARSEGNFLRLGAIFAILTALAVGASSINRLQRQLKEIAAGRDELHAANLALSAEAQSKLKLAEQLRQSQKMEVIGQLTGGLAHDFNNMLAVIASSIELAKRHMTKKDGDPQRFLDSGRQAVERAATSVHRLLAFSRQQPLSPQAIDPNRMVAGMAELLHRSLGETVKLETVLGAGLWRTQADPAQLENAIVNLAVNARDAMPDGGKLTIETNNAYLDEDYAARHIGIPAGQYVLIAISDTGLGVAPEIKERIFDPFFTTKPPGKGTGLGLSQVYGFVRQSGGHIKVYSEPGLGTTMKVYLPRHLGDEPQESGPSFETSAPQGSRGETIVVVEDDDSVRRLAVAMLVELGYRVVAFSNAASALRHFADDGPVDMLFTDVVMPEMNGRQLADAVRELRPELKVLFATGYTQNAIVHGGVLDRGVDLMVKPYPIDKLAKKIREMLDR
jgi:signal transduction histidine kinase